MIAFVRGVVASLLVDSAVVEVGGVGLRVMCTPATLASQRVGAETSLATSMVVREDSLTLFGFAEPDERNLFELLQSASGVGPKLAQAMLAVHGPDEIRRAILTDDLVALCQVPGIGRKGAQRIVLELKDRVGATTAAPLFGQRRATGREDAWRDTVRGALLGLGWSAREADAALDTVVPLADDAVAAGRPEPTADLLRAALRSLSRA